MQYSYSHRYKGNINLSLFDKYYLHVKEKKLNKAREFKLEVATLNPEPVHVKTGTRHWLIMALIAALTDTIFAFEMVTATEILGLDPITMLLALITATTLTALFGWMYLLSTQRKWVLETRSSHYPLIEIPYSQKDKESAKQFVGQLQAAIHRNVLDKEYTTETLFAGEMRMLRRLASKKVLSEKSYDKAKQQMLASQ